MNIFKSFKEFKIPTRRRLKLLFDQFEKPAVELFNSFLLSATSIVADSFSASYLTDNPLSELAFSFDDSTALALLDKQINGYKMYVLPQPLTLVVVTWASIQ